MGLVDTKRAVFGQVAAFRTLNEGLPKLGPSDSFPSLNNGASSTDFLIDLLKILIGFEEIKAEVVDILTFHLSDIELEVKKAIKLELKSIVSCGVNPSIPEFMKTEGIDTRIEKIDFVNILKTNPKSDDGGYVYDDIPAELNSTDFNTFLYYAIQSGDDSKQHWGGQTLSDDLFTITYKETNDSNTQTNILNIKVHPDYHKKKLMDLNNDYIDSISLFGSAKMINNIIDGLFGTLTSFLNKSQKQLIEEEKINTVLEEIMNTDEDKTITDNYFEFSNEQIQAIEEKAKGRQNGIKVLTTCGNVNSSVSKVLLEDLNSNLNNASTDVERKEVISNSLDAMSDSSATGNAKDKFAIKLNFIELFIRRLLISIANILVTPKMVMIFLVNYIIINGRTEEFKDGVDFLRKNKVLIRVIVNKIIEIVLQILLKKALKEITKLVYGNELGKQKERGAKQNKQLLSLVGIPQSVLKMITSVG